MVELRSKVELGFIQLREVQAWRKRISAIRKDIDEYIKVVEPLASAFEITFDRYESSSVAVAADRLVELRNDVERNVRERTNAETAVEKGQHRLLKRKRQLDTVRQEWEEWLQEHGLHGGLTPDTVVRLQERVEIWRNHLRNVQNWQRRIEAIQTDINNYTAVVRPLAWAFEIPFDENVLSTVAAAADKLVELLERVQARVRDRTDAEAELKEANRQLGDRKGDLDKVEEELTQLLRSGDAEDAEDFRLRAEFLKKAGRTRRAHAYRTQSPTTPQRTR